jgi:hypothetical protein
MHEAGRDVEANPRAGEVVATLKQSGRDVRRCVEQLAVRMLALGVDDGDAMIELARAIDDHAPFGVGVTADDTT